ncbi:MAG: hypothetical protein WAN59_01700 [Candidatus Baltobacteraceae bacterium]
MFDKLYYSYLVASFVLVSAFFSSATALALLMLVPEASSSFLDTTISIFTAAALFGVILGSRYAAHLSALSNDLFEVCTKGNAERIRLTERWKRRASRHHVDLSTAKWSRLATLEERHRRIERELQQLKRSSDALRKVTFGAKHYWAFTQSFFTFLFVLCQVSVMLVPSPYFTALFALIETSLGLGLLLAFARRLIILIPDGLPGT